jgi:hypothetical protein
MYRANVVWFRGQLLHPGAEVVGLNEAVEITFDARFIGGWRVLRCKGNARAKQEHEGEQDGAVD